MQHLSGNVKQLTEGADLCYIAIFLSVLMC